MKYLSGALSIIICLAGCAQVDYDYKLENNLLNCFYSYHKERDIDIKDTIDKLEGLYIEHGILSDKTGQSYIHLIEQFRDKDGFDIGNPHLLLALKSIGYIPSGLICQDSAYIFSIDSSDLANSKLKYLFGIYDSIQVKGDLSPKVIAGEILEVLNAKDFENDYYKTLCILMLTNSVKLNDAEIGLTRTLPPVPDVLVTTEKQNILKVYINKENKVTVDGTLVEISDLKSIIKKFLLETSDKKEVNLPLIGKQLISKGVVSLQNEKETSYNTFLSVQSELLLAYDEIRDNYSKQFFQATFGKLSKEKQEVIQKLVPVNISEAEPEM